MHTKYLYYLTIITLLVTSCSNAGSSGGSGNTEPGITAGNGHAVIDGPDFGEGSASLSVLRKELPVEVNPESDSRLSVPSIVYAMRSSDSTDYLKLVIPITNVSSDPLIDIYVWECLLLDADGQPTHVSPYSLSLHGSVGTTESGDEDYSGLAPGETGYALLIKEDKYSMTESVQFTVAADSLAYPSAAELTPTDYWMHEDALIVRAENTGDTIIDVVEYFYWIGLHSDDTPVIWGIDHTNPSPANTIVDPGERYRVEDPSATNYDGTVYKVVVLFDFAPYGSSSSAVIHNLTTIDREGLSDEERTYRLHDALESE